MLKEMNGAVSLTAVAMFGTGAVRAIPVTNHTLQIALGGIAEKLSNVNGQLENVNICA